MGPPAIFRLGEDGFNQIFDLFPGHHQLHLPQKDLPPRLLALDSVFRISESRLDHNLPSEERI